MAMIAWARVLAPGLSSGMSAAVSTARTPGSARAFEASMRLIRACAYGLRSSRACSIPGSWISATYWVRPVTFSGASNRGMDTPMPRTWRVVIITATGSVLPCLTGGADSGHHLRVARAAAQVAGDAQADVCLSWGGVLGQQRAGRHQHAWDAEATLRHAMVNKRLLHGVQLACFQKTFDGSDVVPAGLHGQHQTARDGLAIQVHGARTTVAGAAALFR